MELNGLTIFIFGFGTVFIGLVALIFVISAMSFIYNKIAKKASAAVPAAKVAPAPAAKEASASAADDEIENRGEFVAAVSAAIATVMGKDVSGLRIVSIKKVK